MATELQSQEQISPRSFLPFLVEDPDKLDQKQISKLSLFEEGLKNEIKKTDSVEGAIVKIVRMALAAEFGAAFVKSRGVNAMIESIVKVIMSDNTLRKQALLIIDRFAK